MNQEAQSVFENDLRVNVLHLEDDFINEILGLFVLGIILVKIDQKLIVFEGIEGVGRLR